MLANLSLSNEYSIFTLCVFLKHILKENRHLLVRYHHRVSFTTFQPLLPVSEALNLPGSLMNGI